MELPNEVLELVSELYDTSELKLVVCVAIYSDSLDRPIPYKSMTHIVYSYNVLLFIRDSHFLLHGISWLLHIFVFSYIIIYHVL